MLSGQQTRSGLGCSRSPLFFHLPFLSCQAPGRGRVGGLLLALATLFAAPLPAPAQTDNIWSASITTVGIGTGVGIRVIDAAGSITDPDFEYDGTTYDVFSIIVYTDGTLQFQLTTPWPQEAVDTLEFRVGSASFPLSESSASETGKSRFWGSSGLHWTAGSALSVTLREKPIDPGQPTIAGTAQVGQTLTVGTDDLKDADGLTDPTYTYQWVRVAGGTETNISGATASTYTLTPADAGAQVKVTVSFTDDANNPETRTSDAYPSGLFISAAQTACPADHDWCATLTLGYRSSEFPTTRLHEFAYNSSSGALVPATFSHAGTNYTVTSLYRSTLASLDGTTVLIDTLSVGLSGGVLPDGAILNVAGTPLTVGTDTETATVGQEEWDLKESGVALAWVEGAEVTLSLRFSSNTPPMFGEGMTATRQLHETLGNQTLRTAENIGAAVTATDADMDSLTYRLEGTDASKFTVVSSSGQLRTKVGEGYDHEVRQRYEVTLKAEDDQGGMATIAVSINIENRDEPPLAPGAPAVTASTGSTTSIDVRWTAPNNSGRPAITDYDLRYRAGTSGSWTDGPQGVNGTSASITGLTENTAYQVQVRATNADGNGIWSPSGTRSLGNRNPGNTGGGGSSGGGGGGGGESQVQDQHGDTPGQATVVTLSASAPWASSTPGQLNSPIDVDYFTLTVPQAGLLVVETTGTTDTVGTVWQAGVELGQTASGGAGQNFHLSVPVAAGAVVIAVAGTGQPGRYTLETHLVVGHLENPGVNSYQSGIGVLSGWTCAADVVAIEIETAGGQVLAQAVAYGTARLDTQYVCGDSDNGFGLLFNWNLLGDGAHEVIAYVDGVELARATVTVTTLGAEFVLNVEGACVVADFPSVGESVRLVWQEASQSFVLAEGSAPTGASRSGIAGVGYLENPSANSFQSGIGVISGWVCEADAVTITLGDLAPQAAGYGTERLDTLDVCGDTDNGFGLLFNWNLLGDGEHTVIATVDETELARTTVRVTTLGEEFVWDVTGECTVADFPHPGETVTLTWQESSQNFVITDVE